MGFSGGGRDRGNGRRELINDSMMNMFGRRKGMRCERGGKNLGNDQYLCSSGAAWRDNVFGVASQEGKQR
jgi:hypothetical protein